MLSLVKCRENTKTNSFSFIISVKSKSIVVAGGIAYSGVEVVSTNKTIRNMKLPNLPLKFGTMAFFHNNTLANCDPGAKTCYQLQNDQWKPLNTLNKERDIGIAVSTDHASYIFGGAASSKTYEYLPKNSDTWILGKNEIPIQFDHSGCSVALSNEEIFLITNEQILKFDTSSETFTIVKVWQEVDSKWKPANWKYYACSIIPGTQKIIVTGGEDEEGNPNDSTKILHVQDDGEIIPSNATSMNVKRNGHGIGLFTIQGEERIAVFGGFDFDALDSIETFNYKSGKWELSEFKLSKRNNYFGSVSLPNDFILSMLPSSCGQRNSLGSNDNLKIASAEFGEFPHMCTIMKKNSGTGSLTYLGGASLITRNVVLTAAKVLEYG